MKRLGYDYVRLHLEFLPTTVVIVMHNYQITCELQSNIAEYTGPSEDELLKPLFQPAEKVACSYRVSLCSILLQL